MANYSAIKAAVNAYIKANGRKEITGMILNSVLNATIDSLGRFFQFAGGAIPADDPGTPDQNVCYLATEPGLYTHFGNIRIANEEVALLFWNGEWVKESIALGIQEVTASVDNQVGTPSVDVSYSGGQLVLTFHNLKGEQGIQGIQGVQGEQGVQGDQGVKGDTGAAAGFGTIGADITGGVGTPGVSVESSGDNTSKNLMFHFTNLKGETGVTSVVATIDNTSGTPSCQVSLVNGVLTLAFSGLKGLKGDTGVSADYPIAIYNGLDSDATDQALAAAQGKVLDGKVSQLRQEADDLVEVTGLIPETQNLFDATTAVNCKLINSAGSVVLSNNAQSYIVPVSPGKLVTVDHKTTGNRFAIWSFAKYPAVGDVPIQTVSNNSASSLNITLCSTEKYILIYVNTSSSSTVNVDNLRVYYGTQFIEKTSTALWYEQNIPSIPLKIFDSITDTSIQGFVTAEGGVSQSSNYKRSDYLAVRPNHKYKLTINGFVCAYDQNKQVISNSGYQGDGALIDVDYTTPANCAYVIVSARCDGEYVENSGFFKFYDLAPDYRIADSFLRWKPMNGKKIVVFGDSIAGNYRAGWPLMLQEKTGALVYNCGFGGCRMELLNGEDVAQTNPFAMCSLVDSIISGDWTAQEESSLYASSAYIRESLALLETIDFSEIDIVLIAYGTNEVGYPQDDVQNPTSKYTYAGATRYSLNTLMGQYKQLGVLLLTPIYRYSFSGGSNEDSDTYTHPIYGGKLTDNVATLKAVAQEYKVPCLDMYYQLGINKVNRDVYYYDGTHLNYEGLERYSGFVAQGVTRYQ